MGITNMQGTSAFIQYIGPRGNLKRHSCLGCLEYFDGICKTKKVALDGYSDNNARVCKFYKINKEIIADMKRIFCKTTSLIFLRKLILKRKKSLKR